jgi:hypothetical protein
MRGEARLRGLERNNYSKTIISVIQRTRPLLHPHASRNPARNYREMHKIANHFYRLPKTFRVITCLPAMWIIRASIEPFSLKNTFLRHTQNHYSIAFWAHWRLLLFASRVQRDKTRYFFDLRFLQHFLCLRQKIVHQALCADHNRYRCACRSDPINMGQCNHRMNMGRYFLKERNRNILLHLGEPHCGVIG